MRALRTIAMTLVLACVLAAPGPAGARESIRVTAPAVEAGGLDARWSRLLNAEPGSRREDDAYAEVVAAMRELGYVSMPAHATVLLQDAASAAERGDVARAAVLRGRAAELAPGLAEGHFFDARQEWENTPWHLRAILSDVAAGYAGLQTTVAGRSVIGILWRKLLASWFGLFACAVAAGFAIRHAGRVAHDFRLATLRALTLGQASALVGLAMVAPALILWSPFAFVVCVLAVTSMHLGYKERGLALSLVVGIALLPRLAAGFGTLVVAHEPGASRIVSAVVSPCDDRCLAMLEAAGRDGDTDAVLARAWVLFKRGTPELRNRAMDLVEGMNFGPGSASSAAVLQGNDAFMSGEMADAEEWFLDAHRLSVDRTQRAVALYNLYRVHNSEQRPRLAEDSIRAATSEDDAYVSHYLDDDDARTMNRALAVSPIPAAVVAERLLGGAEPDAVVDAADQFLAAWYGELGPGLVYPACAVILLLLVVGVLVKRMHVVSKRCVRCATPVSRRVLEEAYDADLCIPCYQLVAASEQLARDQLDLREARAERWAEAAPKLALAANIAIPGLGVAVSGRTVRGALLTAVFGGALTLLLVPSPVEQLTHALGSARGLGGHGLLAVVLMVVAYPPAVLLSRYAYRPPPEDEQGRGDEGEHEHGDEGGDPHDHEHGGRLTPDDELEAAW